MRLIAVAAVLVLLAPRARALGSAANGTTGADFLNLQVGARAVAMGGAYAAVADDATALYWNPAGLAAVARGSLTLMHAAYAASTYFDYAAYAQGLGRFGAAGVSLQYFSAGSIAQTDVTGANVGSFAPYDLALSFGYAYRFRGSPLLDGFSVGAAGKYVESHIATTARTEAVDLGLRSPDYLDGRLRLALTLANLGGGLTFDQADESLPTAWHAGCSFLITPRWLASLDVGLPRGGEEYEGVGTEYVIFRDAAWAFAGRAGFNTQTLQGIDGFTGPSFGFGVGYRGGSVDYAFVPLGGLGQAQRVSLNYGF